MTESLRLEFTITPKDIEDAQEALLEKKVGRIGKWFWLTFTIIGLAIGAVAMWLEAEPPYRPYIVVLFVIVVSAVLVFQWWRDRRERPPIVVEISHEEVRVISAGSSQTVPWSTLGTLVETEAYFVLPERKGILSYVLPKRAFPDEHSCEWLRAVAEAGAAAEAADTEPDKLPPSSDHRSVALEFRMRYRDHLDRSLASWANRGFVLFVMAIMLVSFGAVALDPPEDAVLSTSQVFLCLLPFMIGIPLLVMGVVTTLAWISQLGSVVDQTVTLSPSELTSTSTSGQGTMSWQTPTFFKETPWSFIVWSPSTGGWILLPKRAFATVDGANRCREILEANAKRSTWYFGR